MARKRFAVIASIWIILVTQAAWVLPGATRQTEKKYQDSVSQKNMNDKRNRKKLHRKKPDSLNSYLKDTTKTINQKK